MVTFYVENAANKASSAWLRLPPELAEYLLAALGYESSDLLFFRELAWKDLLSKIVSVLRQFALGRGREFTSTGVNEPTLRRQLAELQKVAERARDAGTTVLLFNT
jgi:hypothetical protein